MFSFYDIKGFQKHIYKHVKTHPRIKMPWRESPTPYHVLLSEFMLQQTQVTRVIEYYSVFIKRWKTLESLAKAQLGEILLQWKGLGYYRRARFLHLCVQYICKYYKKNIPSKKEELLALPGVGEYTASAIIVFAYNKPAVMVETNIRRAIIHCFLKNRSDIDEIEISNIVEQSMDTKRLREWYWALMDYGAELAKTVENPNRRSRIYRKQSTFHGSNRQVRSAVLRVLMDSCKMSLIEKTLIKDTKDYLKSQGRVEVNDKNIYTIVSQLVRESLIVKEKSVYTLPQ